MTETEMKLRDAATQMLMANNNAHNENLVRSCVNSYIASARSVTMVMERESSKKALKKEWYKSTLERLGEEPLFRFFNQQRVYTIHKGVIQPQKKSQLAKSIQMQKAPANGLLSGDVVIPKTGDTFPFHNGDIVMAEKDGTIWGWYFTEHKKQLPNHSGNVFALCEDYFAELKALFIDWSRLG